MEDQLEMTTLMAYQLYEENTRLKNELRRLKASGAVIEEKLEKQKPPKEEELKGPPESSKRKLFLMRMALMNFQLKENRFPETVQELKQVLGEVPVEDRSKSNVIHLTKNGRGGWVYDPDEGTLDFNTYNGH
ncbi:MAG: hypothetical protein D6767_10515 [Candidatus Hydrogenedentota bacterium]|nr:MAG: hypothetical protein D6767_10515 [Candidatus Hydrogenedentota bacterium]